MPKRRLATVAIVLLSSALPFLAMTAFCGARRCCAARPHASTVSVTANPRCCGQTNCETAARRAQATTANRTTLQPQSFSTAAPAANVVVAHAPRTDARGRIATASPPPRPRLATSPVLLI